MKSPQQPGGAGNLGVMAGGTREPPWLSGVGTPPPRAVDPPRPGMPIDPSGPRIPPRVGPGVGFQPRPMPTPPVMPMPPGGFPATKPYQPTGLPYNPALNPPAPRPVVRPAVQPVYSGVIQPGRSGGSQR